MTVLVVGSVALDSVETPFGKADLVIGGSGTFFSASASHLSPVQLVGVVGDDYPMGQLVPLARPLPPRSQLGGDTRDAPRRLLAFQPEDPRAVPQGALRVPRQHRSAAPARRAASGRSSEARGVRHDELLDRELASRS